MIAQSINVANSAQEHSLESIRQDPAQETARNKEPNVLKPSAQAPHSDTRSLSSYASSHLAMSPHPSTRSTSPTKREQQKTQEAASVKVGSATRHQQGGPAHTITSSKRAPTPLEPPSSPMTFFGGGAAAAQDGADIAAAHDQDKSSQDAEGGKAAAAASASRGRYRLDTPSATALLPSAIARYLAALFCITLCRCCMVGKSSNLDNIP